MQKMIESYGQNISVRLEDQFGEIIEQSDLNFVDLTLCFRGMDVDYFFSNFAWLSTIDPYGHTVYNYLQIPRLISEFNRLRLEADNSQATKANQIIDQWISLLGRAIDERYLVHFIGD